MTQSAAIIGVIWLALTLPLGVLGGFRIKRGPEPWTVVDALLAFICLFWVALGPSLMILFGSAGSMLEIEASSTDPPPELMAWMIGCSLLGSGGATLFAWLRAGPQALGLSRLSAAWALKSALIALPLFAIFWGVETLLKSLGVEPEPQMISLAVAEISGGPLLVVMMFLIIVCAPVLEEVVFRGFIQPALVRSTSAWLGIGLTALLFAVIHGPNLHALGPIFVLGLVLGWLRQRTGTVIAPMILHIVNNAGAMLLVRILGV